MKHQYGMFINPEMGKFINDLTSSYMTNMSETDKQNIENFSKMFTGQGNTCGNSENNEKSTKNSSNSQNFHNMKRKCWRNNKNMGNSETLKNGIQEIQVP